MPLKLTPRLAKQVNKTVRTTCANYLNGNCLLLDNGDSHPCIQLLSVRWLYCNYLQKYVLSADKELYERIIKFNQN